MCLGESPAHFRSFQAHSLAVYIPFLHGDCHWRLRIHCSVHYSAAYNRQGWRKYRVAWCLCRGCSSLGIRALLPQFLQQPISCGLASHRGDEYLEVPVAMEHLHTQTYVYTLHACNRISTYLCFIDLTPSTVDSPSTVLKPNVVCFLTAL